MSSPKNMLRDFLADCLGDAWKSNHNVYANPERSQTDGIKKGGVPCRAVFTFPAFSTEPLRAMQCPIWRPVFTVLVRLEKNRENEAYDLADALHKKASFTKIPPFSFSEPLQSSPYQPVIFDGEYARWAFELRLTRAGAGA